jgi:hypothetical protein
VSVLALLAACALSCASTPDPHDLSGTIRLLTASRAVYAAGECPTRPLTKAEQAEKARNPNWNPNVPRGKRVDPGSRCDGKDIGDGFADVTTGTDVTIRNEKGEVIGVGKAQAGSWRPWRLVWGECRMTFEIPAVPAAKTYEISIAGRLPQKRSYREIQERNYTVELTVQPAK